MADSFLSRPLVRILAYRTESPPELIDFRQRFFLCFGSLFPPLVSPVAMYAVRVGASIFLFLVNHGFVDMLEPTLFR